MNIVSLASVDISQFVFKDNLKLEEIFKNNKKIIEKFELLLTRKERYYYNLQHILEILEKGTSEDKIKMLELLDSEKNPVVLAEMILLLNDDSIQVRGEAFSSLVLNKNEISNILIKNLKSPNKNIRGFTLLILANRNETNVTSEIIKLVKDEHSMVRSCALGALGHLKVKDSEEIFIDSLSDTDMEVKKSALQSIIDLKITVPENKIKEMSEMEDKEIQRMLFQLKNSGPEGI